MHVAYIHQHFTTRRGATGTRSYEMSRRLLAAGHRVTMICGAYESSDLGQASGARVAEHEIDGIRVLQVNEPYANRMGGLQRMLAFRRFARAATGLVGGLDADLVFASSTPLTVGLPGMHGARRLGVPFVFEVRDLWPELLVAMGALKNPVVIWYLRRLELKLYRAAHRIIALAPGMKDWICKCGYPAEHVRMIPNCSDLDLFQPSDQPLVDGRFGAPDDFRLVFTGAHGQTNGLDDLLDGIAELKRRAVQGVRFVFIGQGGQKPRLVQRSQNEGFADLCAWVDPIPKEELARVLPRMDVGLMTLRNVPGFYYATSPNKFFDYIAAGLPVLNNYPGWLADMIAEHDCGVVVKPDDPGIFADAVIRLRESHSELPAMGRRARALAEAKFGRDQLGAQFVEALEEARASY